MEYCNNRWGIGLFRQYSGSWKIKYFFLQKQLGGGGHALGTWQHEYYV